MSATSASLLPQLQHAQLLLQQGRGGEAWSLLAPLRPAMDGNGQALRLYALAAQGAGRIDEAATALQRILKLEKDPPEILGALADMLGSAGRHGEALVHWDRLVALHPELADAHLNRAIAAADAGQHDPAIAAANAGLNRFPGHARLLAVRALALKNAGRIEESVRAFETAVAADPQRPLTRHNQAVALRAAGRFDEACDAFKSSEKLGMTGAQFYANWAAAALEAGRIEAAQELYGRALAQEPEHPEALKALTRLHLEYETGKDPFEHYERLARQTVGTAQSWLRWANELALHRRFADVAAVAAEGLAHHPSDPTLPLVRDFGAGMAGDPVPSAERLRERYTVDASNEMLWLMLAQVSLRAGMPELAAEAAGRFASKHPHQQTAWSILSLAWRVLEDPREQWLCDYDHLVLAVEVTPPDGALTSRDYAAQIAELLTPLHTTLAAPGTQSLRHGTQTSGALFDSADPRLGLLREAVSKAAAAAVGTLPRDEQHPFLSRKATRFHFSGSWSVRLRAGSGHHVPHFHSEGWMSSAYYARLPALAEGKEGWIEFGRPPAIFNLDLAPRRVIEPREGLLVLFPSYMWHGTVPFKTGDRLTAAFDFLPLEP